MNFFGIGLPEMAVIAAIGLLVFGPKRLPELGKTLGRTLKGFQSASQEFEQEFRSAINTEPVPSGSAPASVAGVPGANNPDPTSGGDGSPDRSALSLSQAPLEPASLVASPDSSPDLT